MWDIKHRYWWSPPALPSVAPQLFFYGAKAPLFWSSKGQRWDQEEAPNSRVRDIPAFLWSKSERTQPLPEDQWATVLLKCKATTGGKDWMARWVGGGAQQPHFWWERREDCLFYLEIWPLAHPIHINFHLFQSQLIFKRSWWIIHCYPLGSP